MPGFELLHHSIRNRIVLRKQSRDL